VRTVGRPEALLAAVRRELQSFDSGLTLYDVRTMEDTLDLSLWAPRLGAAFLTLLALLALALAVTGVYAVLAYSAHQRLKEVGIRVALGAGPGEILRLLVGRAMAVVGVGLGLGLAAAAAGGRLVSTLLYGIQPADPSTLAEVAGTLALVAFAASYTAVRGALRLPPAWALHAE
jgi:putative ABC transport system permease protein